MGDLKEPCLLSLRKVPVIPILGTATVFLLSRLPGYSTLEACQTLASRPDLLVRGWPGPTVATVEEPFHLRPIPQSHTHPLSLVLLLHIISVESIRLSVSPAWPEKHWRSGLCMPPAVDQERILGLGLVRQPETFRSASS